MRLAGRAYRQSKPEYKVSTIEGNASTFNTSYSFIHLTGILQGTGATNRIGNRIRWQSVFFNSFIVKSASATNTMINFILMIQRNTSGTAPDINGILNNVTAGVAIVSSRNLNFMNKYKILRRYSVKLDSDTTNKKFKFMHKFRGGKILNYEGNAGDITDLTNDSIFLLIYSNQSTNVPSVTYSLRSRFTDV